MYALELIICVEKTNKLGMLCLSTGGASLHGDGGRYQPPRSAAAGKIHQNTLYLLNFIIGVNT
jgi:hypothetical protein